MAQEQCVGCEKYVDEDCIMYKGKCNLQWTRIGGCAGRTHNRVSQEQKAFFLNPLKASKRSRGKKA